MKTWRRDCSKKMMDKQQTRYQLSSNFWLFTVNTYPMRETTEVIYQENIERDVCGLNRKNKIL